MPVTTQSKNEENDNITTENLVNLIKLKQYPKEATKNQKRALRRKADSLIENDGKIYKKEGNLLKLFFNTDSGPEQKETFVYEIHNRNHSRFEKTFSKIQTSSVGISRDFVRNVLKKCKKCQISNKIQTYNVIKPIMTRKKFERFQMDQFP